MRSKKRIIIVILLCIIMILSYISVVFLLHAHDCVGSDCNVCALLEISYKFVIDLVLIATVKHIANNKFTVLSTNKSIPFGNVDTPVALKVKLSD